jgi:anti-sigma regulatory factor (Ser/Thr protein kinase)
MQETAVPLNRPALTLGPGPRGVQDARRWVIAVCRDIGRHDLLECAELGVSELVTNAVLHGADPIQVRVRGTHDHPRVEVRDASVESPVLPGPLSLDPDDDLLLTFGRGLSIVARVSAAWGADIESDGKVVWFSPASEVAEDDGVEGVVTGQPGEQGRPEIHDPVEVQVLAVPVKYYVGFQHHFRELRREVRLLALAHGHDYPLATRLSELFESLDQQLRDGMGQAELAGAVASGADLTDLHVRMPRSAATTIQQLIDALDVADGFCRQERLLALARTIDQRDFQRWFLGEYVRQAAGAAPTPWSREPDRQVG